MRSVMSANVEIKSLSAAQVGNFDSNSNNNAVNLSFINPLNMADLAYRRFDRIPDDKETNDETVINKKRFVKLLEAAFIDFLRIYKADPKVLEDKTVLHQVHRLFFLLGRSEYAVDMIKMETARRFFHVAWLVKLGELGLESKETLTRVFAIFSEERGLTTFLADSKACGELVFASELLLANATKKNDILDTKDKKQLFELACTLRWIGHCCQNIPFLNKEAKRFEAIYNFDEQLLLNIIDRGDLETVKEAKWEMAELLYNTERFMHDFFHPNDPVGKINLLNHVLPFLTDDSLRVQIKKAQIKNIMAKDKSELPDHDAEECLKLSNEALEIAEKTPDFDPFLLHMFLSNNVKFALNAGKTNFPELKVKMDRALSYFAINPHIYNPNFANVAAQLQEKMKKGLEIAPVK